MAAGLYGANKDEFLVSLAALALYDGGAEVTSDNISLLINASGNKVAPYWPGLFAGFLKDRMETMIFTVGSVGAAGGAAAAPAGSDAAAPAGGDAPKKEEKKEEVVDALDGGMDLFGGGGGGGGDY